MANIREYNMNGTLILGIDHGYGNIKTAHRVFPTALIKSEKAPTSVKIIWSMTDISILSGKVIRALSLKSSRMMIIIS